MAEILHPWVPRFFFRIISPMLVLCFLIAGCASISNQPTIVLQSPPHGSQYHEGEEVAVQTTSTDLIGVTSVDLVVDGIAVQTTNVPGASGQLSFSCIQTWKATPGAHTISVYAHNVSGLASEPATISISVLSAVALVQTPTATPTLLPTATATLSPTPVVTPSRTQTAGATGVPVSPTPSATPSFTPTMQVLSRALLAPPSGFTATSSGTTIVFNWLDNSSNESGFRIYKIGQAAPVVALDSHPSIGGMTYQWTNLPCNQDGVFYVRAFNAAGESASSETSAATTVPCAPDLTVESATQTGSLYVNLADNSPNEAGFHIYRSDLGTLVATLAARPGMGSKGSTAIGPFPCGSRMTLFARAYNAAGDSTPSSVRDAAMLACPVNVMFTSVDVIDAAHPKPGPAQFRLKFTVNNQIQYWPSATTYQGVQNGDARTFTIAYSFRLMRDTNLALKVEGITYDASTQPALLYDLGKVETTYTPADDWSKGPHADESIRVDGQYRIHYSIAVTQ